jgi:hypothetical protein
LTPQDPIENTLAVAVTALLAAFALFVLVRGMRRTRRDLPIAGPVAGAFALRLAAAGAISLTGLGSKLRGGDELGFLYQALLLSRRALFSDESLSNLTSQLHVWLFSLQLRLLDSPDFALRITQVAISVAGLALVLCAVYDLAGRRAAWLSGWLIAIEPGTLFFSSLLHKEANMYLAEGLVLFGVTRVWVSGRMRGIVWVALGCMIAVVTRPYAGWFLAVAAGLALLHGSLRPSRRSSREGVATTAFVLVLALAFAPLVWTASSQRSLASLQIAQNANAGSSSSLKLEQVDFSSRSAIVLNLPQRVFDVVFKPYPWQLGDVSQQLGLLGSAAVLLALAFLVPALWRSRGSIISRAGPLVYVSVPMLCGYALSAGNAGTAFRYRTHVLVLVIAIVCALRARAPAPARDRSVRRSVPLGVREVASLP